MTAGDLAFLPLARAAEMIRRREVSPVELLEACLARIAQVDGRLNAFITVDGERAMAAAREATEAIARGEYRGPLHGVPVALKDLFDVTGLPTTAGSRILAQRLPDTDAPAVARLKGAGAIIIGKLNLHEFAFGATGVNPHYGTTLNPWDSGRIAGGSSSGSGAAVAAGECFAALGTDTGGSIRIPAALCGVVGLKPTYGRISRRRVIPLSWALDHVGPLARRVEDVAIVLGVIAGRDPEDPATCDEPVPDYRAELAGARDLRGLRLGLPREHFFEGVDGEVVAAVRRAIRVLEGLGAEVVEVSLPRLAEAAAAVGAIMLPEALAYHRRWLAERPQDYGEDVRHRLEMGMAYLAVHYVQAQRLRALMVEEWRRDVFSRVDLLAAPTTSIPAPPVEASDLETTMALVRCTNPFNLLGIPVISVPCGFTAAGLPIGMQLAGRWFEEATVLRAAHVYEQATGWHNPRPPL